MHSAWVPIELGRRVGYELKRVQAMSRAALQDALTRHGLTLPQYTCLELLDQRASLSNAEIARAAFVSRQAMNGVLQTLRAKGLVEHGRGAATAGRAVPLVLTREGRRRLAAARDAVMTVERKMIDG
ncbi:MarR family winged helix-turn-helix transcriptional regulator, partial [Allorhizocola rhizosphaerae]|uniref:MarR family winged helix-turn-helix transcriptional regulator n=1 Tax=Allorhizocola rhizosphaerae TaxID=1872709 RepID=UPI000E3DEB4C